MNPNLIETYNALPEAMQLEVEHYIEFLSIKTKQNRVGDRSTDLTPEQRAKNWIAWVETMKQKNQNPNPLPDLALHRDSMYE
jgi:hypothetical protein